MPDPTQFDLGPIRVALDQGEVVELDGCPRGSRVIPNRQRLATVAVLGEREAQLSRYNTSPWSRPPRGGFRSPTAARSSRTLCSLRSVRKRSRRNTPTSP